jgi:hypothetical protein
MVHKSATWLGRLAPSIAEVTSRAIRVDEVVPEPVLAHGHMHGDGAGVATGVRVVRLGLGRRRWCLPEREGALRRKGVGRSERPEM